MSKLSFLLTRFSFFICGTLLIANTAFAWDYLRSVNNPIVFASDDISGTGVVVLENCDDCGKAIDIGFPFTFYGRTYTQLYVVSNGFIIMGGSRADLGNRSGCCVGRDIPYEDNLEGVLAPWWNDLSMKANAETAELEENGRILYQLNGSSGNYELIIQYDEVRHFHNLLNSEANTFQVILYQADNSIEFRYKKIIPTASIHTIGIESPAQDSGDKYFRTGSEASPPYTENFSVTYTPDQSINMTSSLRYVAAGGILNHVFTLDTTLNLISDIEFVNEIAIDSYVIDNGIDFAGAQLLQTNPARFSLEYTMEPNYNGEGGLVASDNIAFALTPESCSNVSDECLSLESQSVYVKQSPFLDDLEDKVNSLAFNEHATISAFLSKDNLLSDITKSENAMDVFFSGLDPDTLQSESHQLSHLTGTRKCGAPHIDDGDSYTYLYVMCNTGVDATETAVYRYDLDSYLDDNLAEQSIVVAGTTHAFSGDIATQALVVAADGNVAYARDMGSSQQDVYYNGVNIHNAPGDLKSLSIDATGTKLVYVIDNTVYFYDDASPPETAVNANGVTFASISTDGSTIAFNSTGDLAGNNADGSLEIFTVPTATLTPFTQLTDLASGICKLPVLNANASRVVVVCDEDLLGLGNDFVGREGVFVIENTVGEWITHLISEKNTETSDISRLSLSSDGAVLSFDSNVGVDPSAYLLIGLSRLDSSFEDYGDKAFPDPFFMPGDGESGMLYYLFAFIFLSFACRYRKI